MAVFRQSSNPNDVTLLFQSADNDLSIYFQKPEIVKTKKFTILWLWKEVESTAEGNASDYYLSTNNGWKKIETIEWQKDFLAKVPLGLNINKGLWPELETLTVEAGLYKKEDANYCPTGGRLHAQLAIEKNKFVLKSAHILPNEK